MSHHIAVSIVHDNEVVFIFTDGGYQFIFHFIGTHLGFQVIGSYFGRRNQNTILFLERSFATAIKEESNMGVFLGFGNVQLGFMRFRQILAQCIMYILFVEKNMNTLERGIVRRHAIVLQTGNRVHTGLGHILLREHNRQLFGAIVTVIEENNHVALLDSPVASRVYDRFNKFVGYIGIIRFLHGLHHIIRFTTDTVYQKVIGFFHPLPTFVTVHRIISSDNRGYLSGRFSAMSLQLLDKSFTAARIGVTTVHEAVDKRIFQTIFFGDVAQLEQMIQRTVYPSIRGQPHKVDILTVVTRIRERRDNFFVL